MEKGVTVLRSQVEVIKLPIITNHLHYRHLKSISSCLFLWSSVYPLRKTIVAISPSKVRSRDSGSSRSGVV